MSNALVPGEGEVVTLAKVEKADGTVRYLRIADGQTRDLTREEYEAEGGT